MALELSRNRSVNILVFTALVGLLVSALSLWYSTDKKAHINGGSLIASSEKYGVVFSMDKSLYRTDEEARVLNSASYEALGLRPPLADIAFSTEALYVIEASEHTVKKCSVALMECELIGTIPGAKSTLAMDIAITPDNKYYYVSNSSLHRIDKFTIDGEYLYELKMGESLNYPNDIYAIDDTVIAVADSVNSRVIGIEDGHPKGRLDNSRVIWQLNVEKKMGKLGLDWPSALSFSANGRLWVNNQNLYFDKGEIVVYDAKNYSFLHHIQNENGEKVIVDYDSTVVPLNEGAEPRNFAAVKDFMIVGNFNPIEVLKIDDFSLGYGSFLDGIMDQRFHALSESRAFWLGVETLSLYAFAPFILILLFAAFLEMKEIEKRQDEEALSFQQNVEPKIQVEQKLDRYLIEPDENGIVWLQMKGKNIRYIKYISWAMTAMFPLLMGVMIYSGETAIELYLILGGMMILTGLMVGFFMMLLKNVRLGRDEKHIYLVNWQGKRAYALFEEVVFTGSRIIIGKIAIGVNHSQGRELYDKKEFTTYIEPLIPLMQKKNEFELLMINLQKGDPMTWLAVVSILVLFYMSVM